MKKSLVAGLCLLFSAAPASAEQILPYLFATRFCELRSAGVSFNDAMESAVSASTVSGSAPMGTLNGKPMRSDFVLATNAVFDRCPQYANR